jgi:aconitase B
MEKNALLPVDRFLHTLKVVEREGAHLAYREVYRYLNFNEIEEYQQQASMVKIPVVAA